MKCLQFLAKEACNSLAAPYSFYALPVNEALRKHKERGSVPALRDELLQGFQQASLDTRQAFLPIHIKTPSTYHFMQTAQTILEPA